jgi:hypothetical protein
MFGTINVPPREPELSGSTLWKIATADASHKMTMAKGLRYLATLAHQKGYHEVEIDNEIAADRAQREAYALMYPFRFCIELRTTRERMDAESTVTDRLAQFLSGPCAAETCDECARPMWQHIAILDGGTLCPFGRTFWHLARALQDGRYHESTKIQDTLIGVIASRRD